ncbi:MAG: H-X9-DG-CTERM domain-containing protein [Planctomycetota bacterium]
MNVAMADASVRFVSNSISQANWWYMNSANDGRSHNFGN